MNYFKHFQTAQALTVWLNAEAQSDITVVGIVPDMTNGGFTVFYKAA